MVNKPAGGASGRTQTYNLITAAMLALTVVACLSVLLAAVNAGGDDNQEAAAEPTVFGIPTATNTIEGPTTVPTFTPSPTPTGTREPTATRTPTITPTPTTTNTPFTPRPTSTITPTPSQTSQPVTPTPTDSPFDYVLRENQITYTSNFANDSGCDWAGIAGNVFDLNAQHQQGVRVRVTGDPNFEQTVISGSKTEYGSSGWEIFLDSQPIDQTYTVQLVTTNNDPLSAPIEVQTIPECDSNLAFLVFDQVQ